LTNVPKTIATVSPTGMPIKSSDLELLWIKHCRHIPSGGGAVCNSHGWPVVKSSFMGRAEPSFEVRLFSPQFHSSVDRKEYWE
jgi:hypothetical protein